MTIKNLEFEPRPLWRILTDLVLGRIRQIAGSLILVIGSGVLVLWWGFFQENLHISRLLARATTTAEAKLIDRYYLIEGLEGVEPGPRTLGRVTQMKSVAVFEFETEQGQRRRAEFWDFAHDWQHNTPFELGIPIISPSFRYAPGLLSEVDPLRDALAQAVDDPSHWLLRLRQQPLVWRIPIRYDAKNPETVVLDSPDFIAQRNSAQEYVSGLAIGLILFVGLTIRYVLWPAWVLLLPDFNRWQAGVATLIFCTAVPWWSPFAVCLAPGLGEIPNQMAVFLAKEFGRDAHLSFVADTATWRTDLEQHIWRLEDSSRKVALDHVQVILPAVDPLDFAAAFDALQRDFDRQLAQKSPAELETALEDLEQFAGSNLVELFVPALIRLQAGTMALAEATPAAERYQRRAFELLKAFAEFWRLPDVDCFLFRHRLTNYRRLLELEELSPLVQQRLTQAEALIAVQQAR